LDLPRFVVSHRCVVRLGFNRVWLPHAQNVNYPGFRELYEKYYEVGFRLVAFPCNQFGGQAPGTSEEERQYAYRKFGFEFPVMVRDFSRPPMLHFSRDLRAPCVWPSAMFFPV
jgi:Glutathione peroxidase